MLETTVQLTLHELLDANAGFNLAARGTTNHCPMALIALANMGASSTRLQAFFDMWGRDYALPAPPVDSAIGRHEWVRYVGENAAFGALHICFLDWMAEVGHVPVITAVLQDIPFAPATQAFHALIRLAYGIEAAHAGEIAAGLAAFVSSHLPIAVRVNEDRPPESADAAFERIARDMRGIAFNGNSITARLRTVADDERFAHAVSAPPVELPLLDALARATIGAYWRMPDFTVLHTVTATRAARVVFSLLPQPLVDRILPDMWIALCAAYATVGSLAPIEPETLSHGPGADWQQVCTRAIASNDDHVIKMAYTCLCEHRRHASPLYLAAAARLVANT